MKGILMAGGSGSRLWPLTLAVSKQLLPLYNKPMVFYPLSTLMLAEIRDILLISSPQDLPQYERLLGDGSGFGIRLRYLAQPSPDGLAQAFTLGEAFLGDEPCVMILGDNLFYGNGLSRLLREARNAAEKGRATIFGCPVKDPRRFGVVETDAQGRVLSLEEKPVRPKSSFCVTGLYCYPKGVSALAHTLRPSSRGELEITALNDLYRERGLLDARLLGRGYAWFDAGTVDSLSDAAGFVRTVEARQGRQISAPEEIAFRSGWLDRSGLLHAAKRYGESPYGLYLQAVAEGAI